MTRATTTEAAPEPAPVPHTYRVVAPCVVIRGERGSNGIFYQGEVVRTWHRSDGNDMATADVLTRLAQDGFLTAIGD